MIAVVYHCFLVNNWKELIKEQLDRLVESGLYEACDELWTTVTLLEESEEDFREFLKDYIKIQFVFSTNNTAEYLGIKKVKEIGDSQDDAKILYFHTKGVSNRFTDNVNREFCEEKVKNINAWRECLEYFTIDRWKESIEHLKENDCVGVTNVHGWYWGNFWWANSNFIKRCREVGYWGRWDYEAWLNNYVEGEKKFFQWFPFQFNAYYTNIEERYYKNRSETDTKINLISAKYGTGPFKIDEGYGEYPLNEFIDVTEHINKELEKEKNEKFNFHVINYGDIDPSPGNRKFLFVEFTLNSNLEKVYKIGIGDGYYLNFKP